MRAIAASLLIATIITASTVSLLPLIHDARSVEANSNVILTYL
jgi:hypothetical protein